MTNTTGSVPPKHEAPPETAGPSASPPQKKDAKPPAKTDNGKGEMPPKTETKKAAPKTAPSTDKK